jgi:orotidine-5'-phosphate decarboxylase
MLRAGVEGLLEGAEEAGHPRPVPLAVTVLTNEEDSSAFGERLEAAVEAGCAGVVCSALEVPRVKAEAPGLLTVTPGIRLAGSANDDQSRVATPASAVAAGADLLVVGRTVTHATDRPAAAQAVTDEVRSALAD